MSNLKKKLTLLEGNTQRWLETFKKDKNLHKDKKLVSQYKELLKFQKLLQLQLQEESAAHTEITEDIINSGMQTSTTQELVIGDDYRDIKELQTFLTEDNIRDTNPIIILTFGKLLELSIDYLQNLKGMLLVLGKHCHEQDIISQDVQEAILELFKGGKKNKYCFSVYISSMLEKSMSETFSVTKSGKASLSVFCNNLAQETQKLISELQNTKQRKLRKKLGRRFRKHKKAPYPFVGKILTAIDLYDIPYDVAGDRRREEQLKLFANWHSAMLRELGQLDNTHKTELAKQADLIKSINDHGASLDAKFTPNSIKEALFSKVTTNLAGKEIVPLPEVIQLVKNELELLKPQIKKAIKEDKLNSVGTTIDDFVGIPPTEYIQTLQAGILPNQFDTYKKTIKDWVIAVDKLLNQLGIDKEKGKYNYKAKDMIGNLSRLFKTNHPLIGLQDFFNPIQKGLMAEGFSTELTTVDDLFSESINSGSIYQSLIGKYTQSMQAGTFQASLDTLETVLPSIDQIEAAILDTKIDIILNREVQYLNLGWTITWAPNNVLIEMIDSLVTQLDIPQLIRSLGQAFSEQPMRPLDDYINWLELNLGNYPVIGDVIIQYPMVDFRMVIIDAIRAVLGDQIQNLLNRVAEVAQEAINNLTTQLRENMAVSTNEGNRTSTINVSIPVHLSLGQKANGKPFPYAQISPQASSGSIFNFDDDTKYSISCEGIETHLISNTMGTSDTTVQSSLKLNLKFEDPGMDFSVGFSAVVVDMGYGAVVDSTERGFNTTINLSSSFVGNTITVSGSNENINIDSEVFAVSQLANTNTTSIFNPVFKK